MFPTLASATPGDRNAAAPDVAAGRLREYAKVSQSMKRQARHGPRLETLCSLIALSLRSASGWPLPCNWDRRLHDQSTQDLFGCWPSAGRPSGSSATKAPFLGRLCHGQEQSTTHRRGTLEALQRRPSDPHSRHGQRRGVTRPQGIRASYGVAVRLGAAAWQRAVRQSRAL